MLLQVKLLSNPTQSYICSCRVEDADVVSITALFFLLVLMAATQDIAVDGWALTLLARNNVG